ncbi:MAG TPA: ABC transporter ATP-binding protein [Thermoanaerobaculia bacterium]|nr:ABC transporter ATP-binding protein [Thermoanaerobaculia bacterium]
MGARVAVESVSKSYDPGPGSAPVEALADVSLSLEAGTFAALLGPSGCGKSTLLNLLGALDRPTRGRVLVDGRDLAAFSEDERDTYRRRTAATVFQFFNLLPTMNALENVALPLLLDGVAPAEADARAADLLAEVSLSGRERAYPYELSGGQMQRVAVARALANRPSLLLADEPTGNLDSKTGTQVLDLLSGLVSAKGITVVMATHSPDAAGRASRVLDLLDGRLVP